MLKYYTLCNTHTDEEKRKPLNNVFLCLPRAAAEALVRGTSSPICVKAGAAFVSAAGLYVPPSICITR